MFRLYRVIFRPSETTDSIYKSVKCTVGSHSAFDYLVKIGSVDFEGKLDLNLRKKLIKCYIWSMALYGAETWTLRAADQKYLESFLKCGAGEGWRRSVGPII